MEKKTTLCLISALLLAAALPLGAQDDARILSEIASAPARSVKIERRFLETRNFPGKSEVQLEGELRYDTGTALSMIYDNGEKFIIDGDAMTIDRDGKHQIFDTSKNLMMKGLSHALLYSFKGTPDALASEQGCDLTTGTSGEEYLVTLTSRKKAARGYSRIEIHYGIAAGEIRSMRMDEVTGASTYYTFIK